jgi:hypothetical protein
MFIYATSATKDKLISNNKKLTGGAYSGASGARWRIGGYLLKLFVY